MTDPSPADLALALARDLDHALGLADDLGRDFGRDFGYRRANDLASALDLGLGIVLDLGRAIDLGLGSDLGSDHNRDLVRDCARDLARARDLAHDLAPDLVPAYDFDPDRARDLDRAIDLGRAIGHARQLVGVLADADDRGHSDEAAARRDRGRRVAPSAARVTAVAVWMLPAAGRARYAGEYQSEQWELARAGAGRWAQLAYAGRLLRSAVRLRWALREPSRRRAAP